MNGCDLFAELVSRPPLSALSPQLRGFLKDYLSAEKARLFDGRWVINTHLPPYPSRAFEGLVAQFLGGEEGAQRLYSVTWAVTNRCDFGCWHCYNSGRSPHDVPLARMRQIAQGLQERGACMVTLSGGEPLLRPDLEEIAASFDERACLVLNTTGWGLTESRAMALRQTGVFAMGISLDSEIESEHDRLRGRSGAFQSALRALTTAGDAGCIRTSSPSPGASCCHPNASCPSSSSLPATGRGRFTCSSRAPPVASRIERTCCLRRRSARRS
jgi:hypothetical protein